MSLVGFVERRIASAEDFLRLENAIDDPHGALTYHPEQKISKARGILKGVAVAMHVKRTHKNFIDALMTLRGQLSEIPMYQAGRDAARQQQGKGGLSALRLRTRRKQFCTH